MTHINAEMREPRHCKHHRSIVIFVSCFSISDPSDCYSEGGLCRSEEEGCACHEDKCHKIPEDVVMSGLCEVDRDCGLYFKCYLDREAGHCTCSQGH